jgi:thiosulfate reductase cytochrome b subunit
MNERLTRIANKPYLMALAAGVLSLAGALIAARPTTAAEGSPLHPTFPLLDADGVNVLDSGNPVSTLATCGACHDTEFILRHNAHEGILSGALNAPTGEPLVVDTTSGEIAALEADANAVEMNCFLCHMTAPNNKARLQALADEKLAWANTATLLGTGIVQATGDGFTWDAAAFDEDGVLLPDALGISDPTVENCGQCHGVATTDAVTPLTLDTCGTEQRMTFTTGQVFSPQRIADSGLNLADKDELSRTWDVHAERIVACTDCHYSLNNPAYDTGPEGERPDHLTVDPRRLEMGEYLARPFHEFARSDDDTTDGNPCESCHDAEASHTWLPYTDRHMEVVACESCHIPALEAPASQVIDWTVIAVNGGPARTCRGQEKDDEGRILITGYEPVLAADEEGRITPYNLLTSYYWVYGPDETPVPIDDLQDAFFDEDGYREEIITAFDANGTGDIEDAELTLDSPAKQAAVARQLEQRGYDDPHIAGEVESLPIHHGVTHGEWATRDCQTCHGDDSRVAAPILLAGDPPGGVQPKFDGDDPVFQHGDIVTGEDGALRYVPDLGEDGANLYVLGHSRSKVIDWIGIAALLGTLAGVFTHGGLRVLAARRRAHQEPELREVYMYTVYERLWHWLQTAAILLLVVTGLIIHKPDLFGAFSFRYIVQVHNIVAAILVTNAALALFYHVVSGEIRQFLPEPHGFFNQAVEQAKFYLGGIFSGEEHPFEKTPQHKLNPLQQITYLGLLNVLLPLQIITGALMWGAQRWPEIAARLGGLPFLAPVHTLVAWLFASFVVMHVYLTTTGHEPLASIRGMVLGWDEVEAEAEASGAPAKAGTD